MFFPVIPLQKDTDVSEKILNVSFSVREKVEHNADVFYSTQFLREKIYLQRTRLTTLSTLEVSPVAKKYSHSSPNHVSPCKHLPLSYFGVDLNIKCDFRTISLTKHEDFENMLSTIVNVFNRLNWARYLTGGFENALHKISRFSSFHWR